jgi:hypothetical protein
MNEIAELAFVALYVVLQQTIEPLHIKASLGHRGDEKQESQMQLGSSSKVIFTPLAPFSRMIS